MTSGYELRKDAPKKDGTYPIRIRIYVGSTQTKISSGESIDPKYWDDDRNEPKKLQRNTSLRNLAFHRGISHSLLFSVVGALGFGWVTDRLYRSPHHRWIATAT